MKDFFEGIQGHDGMSKIAPKLLVVGDNRCCRIRCDNQVLILVSNANEDQELLLKELAGADGKICSLQDTLRVVDVVQDQEFQNNVFHSFALHTGRYIPSISASDLVDGYLLQGFFEEYGYKDPLVQQAIMGMFRNEFKPNLVYHLTTDELSHLPKLLSYVHQCGYSYEDVHIIGFVDEFGPAMQDMVSKVYEHHERLNGEMWMITRRAALPETKPADADAACDGECDAAGRDNSERKDYSQRQLLMSDGYTAIKLKDRNQDAPESISDEKLDEIKLRVAKAAFSCHVDLESYFTEPKIGRWAVDVLDIGAVAFPTGKIIACDPMVELDGSQPLIDEVGQGTYRVKICVVPHEKLGDRYAAVKLEISKETPVYYELAVTKDDDLEQELEDDEVIGFIVDAGMGCFADLEAAEAFNKYVAKQTQEDEDFETYSDFIEPLLIQSAKDNPKYQLEYGDWALVPVPDTFRKIPIFHSGFGDGVYPVYVGYDAEGKICAMYILFIDIEAEYSQLNNA